MNNNHSIQITSVVALFFFASGISQAEVSANFSMVSDYVFRGISQSQEDPTVQGGFDWAHESGIYLGTWASGVDFVGNGYDDGADIEWDLYLGYAGSINDVWSWDVSYVQYLYPGTVSGVDYDYGEALVAFGYKELVVMTLGYAYDVFNSDETGIYYEVSGGSDIGSAGWSWHAAVGHYDLDDLNSSYTHYSVGVAKAFEKISVGLTIHDSDGGDEFGDMADARAVLSLSSEF